MGSLINILRKRQKEMTNILKNLEEIVYISTIVFRNDFIITIRVPEQSPPLSRYLCALLSCLISRSSVPKPSFYSVYSTGRRPSNSICFPSNGGLLGGKTLIFTNFIQFLMILFHERSCYRFIGTGEKSLLPDVAADTMVGIYVVAQAMYALLAGVPPTTLCYFRLNETIQHRSFFSLFDDWKAGNRFKGEIYFKRFQSFINNLLEGAQFTNIQIASSRCLLTGMIQTFLKNDSYLFSSHEIRCINDIFL
ncbi:hypothetical protein CAEBREN_01722 [Caenorhabditis brenneri]|uniref:Uncharacterized protein n=1 Tax=Caenorhabditis brenneri TaxID=135651 RepID=G0NJE0_CAEBE|nr:hypothetical protein CAEBREN_01722 [Caenorhabditis brenneri]